MIQVKINGKPMTATAIAKLKGFKVPTMINILHRLHWQHRDASEKELGDIILGYELHIGKNARYYATKTAKQWAEILEINPTTYRWRVRQYGVSDKRTYESKEDAQKRRVAKQRKALTQWHKKNRARPAKEMSREDIALSQIKVGTFEMTL